MVMILGLSMNPSFVFLPLTHAAAFLMMMLMTTRLRLPLPSRARPAQYLCLLPLTDQRVWPTRIRRQDGTHTRHGWPSLRSSSSTCSSRCWPVLDSAVFPLFELLRTNVTVICSSEIKAFTMWAEWRVLRAVYLPLTNAGPGHQLSTRPTALADVDC